MKTEENQIEEYSTFGVWVRGLFMGMADVVPGFSGGTVALITGIYQKLIGSISKFDRNLIGLVRQKEWKAAATHVDLAFLLKLAIGIGCGLVVTLLTVHKLLEQPETRPFVLAAFLGMVLGSAWFVFEMIRAADQKLGAVHMVLVVIGAAVAVTTCLLPPSLWQEPPLWYVFVCGAIGICAMILPGISGALILMLLGTYTFFTDIAHQILHFENLVSGLTVCVVFGCGCIVGLLSFSKLLRRLFDTQPGYTLSVLFGLMLGSVVKLWPFRETIQENIEGVVFETEKIVLPESFAMPEWLTLGTVVLSAVIILTVGWAASKKKP